MDISLLMLQVLDDPTGIRIIALTKCPLIGSDESIYFMIDRGSPESHKGANDAEVYEEWRMSDNTGNTQTFTSHVSLIEFFQENEIIFDSVFVESF